MVGYVNQQVGITAQTLKRGSDSLPYVLAQQVSPLGKDGPRAGAVQLAGLKDDKPVKSAIHRKPKRSEEDVVAADEPRILPDLESKPLVKGGNGRNSAEPSESSRQLSVAGLMGEQIGAVVPAAAEAYEEVIEPPAGVPLDASGAEMSTGP